MLSAREKIVHLLNRFAFGAPEHEVDEFLSYGVDATIHHLVNYENVDDPFDVQPIEFFFDAPDKLNMDSSKLPQWWILKMVTTKRPSQEKLSLFWHGHFAVSGAKVGYGPAMLQYLNTIRDHANGNFGVLLEKVSKTPAMVHWLDTDKSLRGRPNENFAREVMELFTLGLGNYTEKDIQEAARAFSGWNVRYPINELGPMSEIDRVKFAHTKGMPMVVFQDAPDLHDNDEKTVLGTTGKLSAEDILDMLAKHPKAAEFLSRKLWEFYAYANPEPKVVERLAKRFTESGGEIKSILVGIIEAPEFWSDKAIGTMVKNPVDFCIGALRQVNAGPQFLIKRDGGAQYDTPVNGALLGDLYTVRRFLTNQGLSLLYPADVSGWKWGAVWATPGAMLDRGKFQDYVYNPNGRMGGPISSFVLDHMMRDLKTATPEQIVDRILAIHNVKMSPEKKAVLASVCKKAGGNKSLTNRAKTSALLRAVARLVYASPEYQLC